MSTTYSVSACFKPPNLCVRGKFTTHLSTSTRLGTGKFFVARPHKDLKFFSRSPFPVLRKRVERGVILCVSTNRCSASSDDGATLETESQASISNDIESSDSRQGRIEDGYVGLFVRMLGLDNDPLDREQAINALWKYSLGGKECIDEIMKYPGCISLAVSLLKSDSKSTSVASAGLLHNISSVNLYRNSVSMGGAIEEITGLLSRSAVPAEVKEQSVCTLWNLSVEEHDRLKIANSILLPVLIKCLDDEDIKVKEASGGVLANLALSQCKHSIMVEEGIIPKLADVLKSNEGSKVLKKEARNVLLELAKDEYYKILIVEAGLILVPIIGSAAYKSLRPVSRSWPSLPDGTELERLSSVPSRFGASELLVGLNFQGEDVKLEEAQKNAIVGRTTQQFLARIGAIEIEETGLSNLQSSTNSQSTLLPCVDGVARLVLMLSLEDVLTLERASLAIADACINEDMRISFKEAGAVRNLVRLLGYEIEAVKLAAAHALEKLSISNVVCQRMATPDAMDIFVDVLMKSDASESLLEKVLNIVARICDPIKEMKTMLADGYSEEKTIESMNKKNGVSGSHQELDKPSLIKEVFREKALESGVIPNLVGLLKRENPNLQQKSAIILDSMVGDEPYISAIVSANVQSGLSEVFLQRLADVIGPSEPCLAVVEEAGLTIGASARLLAKVLSLEQSQNALDIEHFIDILRKILKSDVPLHAKDWVSSCLLKLESLIDRKTNINEPINREVILHGVIPKLVEEIENSDSMKRKEEAVLELKRVISEGQVEYAKEVAVRGGIFPLVKVIDEGGEKTREDGVGILYILAMDSENHAAIIAAGAIPVLRKVIFLQGPEWERALHLLRILTS